MNAKVIAAEQLSRFEVRYGDELAGFAEYLDHDGQRIFFHTEIGERFGGKGLASTLIRQALRETVDAGLRIVPLCPFVESYVGKHDDFADSVDPVTDSAAELVRER
jgi:predicted GNAT family acetyltransferase